MQQKLEASLIAERVKLLEKHYLHMHALPCMGVGVGIFMNMSISMAGGAAWGITEGTEDDVEIIRFAKNLLFSSNIIHLFTHFIVLLVVSRHN